MAGGIRLAHSVEHRKVNEQSLALAREWKRLGRAATAVAILTSPALFVLLDDRLEWPLGWAICWARCSGSPPSAG